MNTQTIIRIVGVETSPCKHPQTNIPYKNCRNSQRMLKYSRTELSEKGNTTGK